MKNLTLFFLLVFLSFKGQNIKSIQLFNPRTNDETPIFYMGDTFILSFDDLKPTSEIYRYTIKHYDRNWQEDNLFFTEMADGALNDIISDYQYSFNTLQPYIHYTLEFPNNQMRPKISGNFKIIVYKDSQEKPLFSKRFCIVENQNLHTGIGVERYIDARKPNLNQRLQIGINGDTSSLAQVIQSMGLTLMQNNNWDITLNNIKPSAVLGNQMLFQQLDLVFPGNNEFFYFDNKNINAPVDMVAATNNQDNTYQTYLYPVLAYPLSYMYNPDVNGAFYFRRNDNGIERNHATEADYSWVYFSLNSEPFDKDIYILGLFNDYQPKEEYKMVYDPEKKCYIARIYLKQGFYNYVLATKKDANINYGEINGNFWQTENLYQALLYYKSWEKNYDGIVTYGELRAKR